MVAEEPAAPVTPVDVDAVEETMAVEPESTEETTEAETLVAALVPVPPAGEGSIFAPTMGTNPKRRPSVNAEMQNAVDAAVSAVLQSAAPKPVNEPTERAAAPDLDIIPLPAGTRMVQIGAYASEAVARQQWQRFAGLHGDLLGDKEHYVQRTNNSGKIFYRLRVAGYETKEDTRAACSALSARGLPCISVTLR